MIEKQHIKQRLEDQVGRSAKPNEVTNAEKDVGILVPLILKELQRLSDRLDKLEQK